MKRTLILLTVVAFFFMCGMAWSAPFLVCDPNPGATKYVLEMDGVELPEGVCEADGSIKYDMVAYVNTGNHNVRVKAGNLWGWTVYSDPFNFNADSPGVPSGFGFSTE